MHWKMSVRDSDLFLERGSSTGMMTVAIDVDDAGML